MIYLGDSLASQLIRGSCEISVTLVTPLDVIRCLEDESVSWQSCVSHDDTAAVLTEILGVNVPCYNGQGIVLNPGDALFIAPLPAAATTTWLRVERVKKRGPGGRGRAYGNFAPGRGAAMEENLP